MTLLITGEDVKKLPLSAREAAMTVKTCELAGRAGWAARSTLGT